MDGTLPTLSDTHGLLKTTRDKLYKTVWESERSLALVCGTYQREIKSLKDENDRLKETVEELNMERIAREQEIEAWKDAYAKKHQELVNQQKQNSIRILRCIDALRELLPPNEGEVVTTPPSVPEEPVGGSNSANNTSTDKSDEEMPKGLNFEGYASTSRIGRVRVAGFLDNEDDHSTGSQSRKVPGSSKNVTQNSRKRSESEPEYSGDELNIRPPKKSKLQDKKKVSARPAKGR